MRKWLGIFLIITGVVMGLYHFSEWYTGQTAAEDLTEEEIETYEEMVKEPEVLMPPPPDPSPLFTSDISREPGEKTAVLLIPKIEQKYSVYWGADDATLKKGVGMFVSDLTTVPGGHGHTVLSGHRDTVFTGLQELQKKDELLVEYEDKIYVYEITDTWITDQHDRTVIVEKDSSTLTLTTCYPFDYIGFAPDRYIVQAKLISTKDKKLNE
ncbi:class D sortase [Planococcus salinus]|uniref:Class D sortase n=1 Tax=Planococcus salinus TaxID=1848460 RepID=A0A3M8P5U0_9BACL|nr:class D sortase [Planococcus salinus]RNF39048.1 class D sortase [Planococcus salinus]